MEVKSLKPKTDKIGKLGAFPRSLGGMPAFVLPLKSASFT
jgi:hypothetical protein